MANDFDAWGRGEGIGVVVSPFAMTITTQISVGLLAGALKRWNGFCYGVMINNGLGHYVGTISVA